MILSEVENLYSEYISRVRLIEQQMKPTDGLFGIGKKVSDDRCHDDFVEKLETVLSDLAKSSPDSEKVSAVIGYIYEMPLKFEENDSVYWMLNAVHGLTHKLTEFLSPEDAERILTEYKEKYPKSKRLPVQKQLIKLLEKRTKCK